MKTFVATKLSPEEYRAFSIRAAELAMSRSGLLKKLALAELNKHRAGDAGDKPRAPRKVAKS